MRRTTLTLCSLAVAGTVLAGCGGDDSDPGETSTESTSASASPTEETASPAASSPAAGECTPPSGDVEYTSGSASLDVTAGPDEGHYDLELDPSTSSGYAAGDKEITGTWLSADEQAVLFIDIEGADPCAPDAFTSIATQGAQGPVFVDSAHTACSVTVTSLTDDGVEGTFSCEGLIGGGEGLERDAEGSFTLAP